MKVANEDFFGKAAKQKKEEEEERERSHDGTREAGFKRNRCKRGRKNC